jgi:23S rRNA (cytidine1920-2'-O)/16S rRNA (cytidine1409-2'-O)-methyltransferase
MPPEKKERLDRLLTRLGLAPTLSQAQRLIMAGQVLVEDLPLVKAGARVPIDCRVTLRCEAGKYVSRGGEKLAAPLDYFKLNVKDRVALDVGASTGGFTHCLLEQGAGKVYAVDVGYGQLAWRLRQDPRVITLERENARYLKLEDLGEQVNLITIDVSFISLTKIIPALLPLAQEEAIILALIKPQFELEKGETKKGVVKEPEKHARAIATVSNFCLKLGLEKRGIFTSPLLGPKGNKEFFILLKKPF